MIWKILFKNHLKSEIEKKYVQFMSIDPLNKTDICNST